MDEPRLELPDPHALTPAAYFAEKVDFVVKMVVALVAIVLFFWIFRGCAVAAAEQSAPVSVESNGKPYSVGDEYYAEVRFPFTITNRGQPIRMLTIEVILLDDQKQQVAMADSVFFNLQPGTWRKYVALDVDEIPPTAVRWEYQWQVVY